LRSVKVATLVLHSGRRWGGAAAAPAAGRRGERSERRGPAAPAAGRRGERSERGAAAPAAAEAAASRSSSPTHPSRQAGQQEGWGGGWADWGECNTRGAIIKQFRAFSHAYCVARTRAVEAPFLASRIQM
jgi:hypothetical protein